ncbi:MAG: hypothetical protein GY856_23730 [bacterium]|nr:hypothetical protein [bacterium]
MVAAVGSPVGRNDPCHCGSHHKYKRCCQDRDERVARNKREAELPLWVIDSRRKLNLFLKYATNVYGLIRTLGSLTDSRRDPSYPNFDVVTTLFFAALLRRPSINATEGDLKQADFQRLVGRKPEPGVKAFSAEVISNVLDKLDLGGLRNGIEDNIWRAERNKVFREGSYGTLRCVAIDGWEPFCSYDRHCPHCLTREVSVKNPTTDEVEKRTQYYHRYVVAMLIGPVLDIVLDIEPVLNAEARRDLGEDAHHEGELTAAHRLIDRLHATYGTFIDVLVLDALYANGPVMTKLDDYGYGGFIVLKKNDNEPLKEALALWQGEGPCQEIDDDEKKEHVEFWDVDDIDTLDTYKGKVRVIRAVITKKNGTRKTWCFAIVGNRFRKISRRTALKIVRSRWHLENTGFGQWVKYWNLGRVYRHTPNAIQAILLLWMLVFNLLQLFVYRRLRRQRKPKDPCDTIIAIVAEMSRDIGAIPERIPWEVLANAARG